MATTNLRPFGTSSANDLAVLQEWSVNKINNEVLSGVLEDTSRARKLYMDKCVPSSEPYARSLIDMLVARRSWHNITNGAE
jgi:hypothetical protein